MCDLKNHNLIEIYRHRFWGPEDHVVRWCRDCGAVVVDVDVDFFIHIIECIK